jgi:hypothetical protein
MSHQRHLTSRLGATVLAAAAVFGGVGAGAAAAKSTTLRLFAKTVSYHAYSSSGAPIASGAIPGPGDYTVAKRSVYSGSSASHGGRVGSVTTKCTLVKIVSLSDLPTSCTSVLTIGHSTLTAKVTLNLAALPKHYSASIVGGTGTYKGTHGSWGETDLTKTESNLVLALKS